MNWRANLRGHLSDAWIERLSQCQRPAARELRSQLVETNALCSAEWDKMKRKEGTLLHFVESKKAEHPDKVLAVRVGDFYEAWGTDAVMLVELAGLNAMAGRAKAGTQWRNLQSVLDSLTGSGLTVAVYEEIAGSAVAGPATGQARKLKTRALAQIVSPAVPQYMFNKTLEPGHLDWDDGRDWLGVMCGVNGYALVEVNANARSVVLRERSVLQ